MLPDGAAPRLGSCRYLPRPQRQKRMFAEAGPMPANVTADILDHPKRLTLCTAE